MVREVVVGTAEGDLAFGVGRTASLRAGEDFAAFFWLSDPASFDSPRLILASLRAFFCDPVRRFRFFGLTASSCCSFHACHSTCCGAYWSSSSSSSSSPSAPAVGRIRSLYAVGSGSLDVDASDGGGPYQLQVATETALRQREGLGPNMTRRDAQGDAFLPLRGGARGLCWREEIARVTLLWRRGFGDQSLPRRR